MAAGVMQIDGVVFIPIPADPADAYELYQTNPLFRTAIEVIGGENVESLLRSGPNSIEVEATRLGLVE